MRKIVLLAVAVLVTLGVVSGPRLVSHAHVVANTYTFAPTADAQVRAGKETRSKNFGTGIRWSVGGRSKTPRDGLLRFQATVPPGKRVVAAKVRAYSEDEAPSTASVDIFSTKGGWEEGKVSWSTAPGIVTYLDGAGGIDAGSWVEWDVTAGVPEAGGEVNFRVKTGARLRLDFAS